MKIITGTFNFHFTFTHLCFTDEFLRKTDSCATNCIISTQTRVQYVLLHAPVKKSLMIRYINFNISIHPVTIKMLLRNISTKQGPLTVVETLTNVQNGSFLPTSVWLFKVPALQ